jgi:hypothetical protein
MKTSDKPVNLERHKRCCKVCAHPKREEIEQDFLNWKSPTGIAAEYGFADRINIHRHAWAFGLFERRGRNVTAALDQIIERGLESKLEVFASAVVAAVQARAKINAQGHWVDRSEHLNMNELFDRMSRDELEAYARDGALPGWFTQMVSVPATSSDSEEEQDDA